MTVDVRVMSLLLAAAVMTATSHTVLAFVPGGSSFAPSGEAMVS